MKLIIFVVMMLWVNAPHACPQTVNVTPEQVKQWTDDFQFILIPVNRHEFVEPYLSFMLVSGDRFVYQTQGSTDNPEERRINKTVIGRITSHQLETGAKGKVTRIKLQVETDAGVSFAAGLTIKPSGEATSWISRKHSSSKRHLTGWLASAESTKFEVGPVSTDLALFPWDLEKTPPSWYDYLLGSRPYQYDYEYLPSGGRK